MLWSGRFGAPPRHSAGAAHQPEHRPACRFREVDQPAPVASILRELCTMHRDASAPDLFACSETSDTPSSDSLLTPHQLMTMWNTAASAHCLRACRELNVERMRRINRLLKAKPLRSYWQDVIERICASDFCCGRATSFVAGFDFLTRLKTHLEVLEGKYDNRIGDRAQFRSTQRQLHNQSLRGLPVTIITDSHD